MLRNPSLPIEKCFLASRDEGLFALFELFQSDVASLVSL
jgi:hypothetical protein